MSAGALQSRVAYDWRLLGLTLRVALADAGHPPLRRLAGEIGVTATDLSRLSSGTNVGIEKVFAICGWMRVDPFRFYRPPAKSTRCTSRHVKPGAEGLAP